MSRTGIMLCYPFEEKRLSRWTPPYLVQPKLDGERCRLLRLESGITILLSSEENIFYSVPHINKTADSLPIGIELDGELYCHGLSFEDIHSRVSRTVNLHPQHDEIEFHCFDIIAGDSQLERTLHLNKEKSGWFSFQYLKLVPTVICETFEDVMRTYDAYIEMGYEGIIVREVGAPYVRRRINTIMKFKPKKKDIYTIAAVNEEIAQDGTPKGIVGSLSCTSDEGTVFNAPKGRGMTTEKRKELWRLRHMLIGKDVVIQYQNIISGSGKPKFGMFIDIPELKGLGYEI